MKTKYLVLLILPTTILSSCGLFATKKTAEKEIAVYDIDKLDDEGNLSSGYQTTLKTRYIEGQELVPFVTLAQYASLYEKHINTDKFTSKVEKVGYSDVWSIASEEGTYFATEINYFTSQIILAGSISSTYRSNDDPRDLKALEYGLSTESTVETLTKQNYMVLNYGSFNISRFTFENEHYFPLGLLDITYSDSSSIYFTYNYTNIISTRDVDNYSSLIYTTESGVDNTFETEMTNDKPFYYVPDYLREYNARLFLYLMDNFYGLKSIRGIKSMTNYYKKVGFYNKLFSSDDEVRLYGYSDALSVLDDNHTILHSVNNGVYHNTYEAARRFGEGCYNRRVLGGRLKQYRTAQYSNYPESVNIGKDILYSADQKTALFSFDSFVFGKSSQVFNEDGSIKDTAKNYDTFIKLVDVLNTIKAKGGVENVVFDISVNGGGVVGVMMKLLSLISRGNSSKTCFYYDNFGQAIIQTAKVDINNDKQYDTQDCFGNDFNFYLLTSDYSFSCGNAFPCYAKQQNIAKIIGQKSGGGECTVAVHYLPNSEYVYHSSNMHIGYFDENKKEFVGFENGATPDIELNIDENFYSIESLNTAIRNAR